MNNPQQLITDHLNIWTDAIKKRGSQGRGSSKKIELHGIKKLRELILELAVRGLLVPQNPNDEPASVLLEKIAAEKAQLVQDGKLKAQHQLPKILEENKPYSLPNGWAWAVLPQVLADDKYSIKRGPFGSAIKKAFFVPKGYKVYEQQNAIYDDFGLGDYYIDEEKYNELKVFEVKAGDLIISCSGTVGKVAVAPETMEKGIINQALLKITLNQNMLTNDYFKILFSAYYMKTETLTDLKGTAQKNMVSVKTLKSEPFPYPPYEELFRIVAKVDELMALCDQLEQQTEDSLTAHQTLVETLLNSLLDAAQTYPGHASGLSDDTVLDIKADIQSHKNKTNSDPFQQTWQRIWENFDALFTTEHSIDQLKQTILQLAVMGKLVPQDPNDEPASVLLEKIAAEKEQLLKDKKIKPQKKAKVFDQSTTPSLLPAGWMSVDFGDVTFNRDAERIPLSVSDRNMRQGEYDYYGASGVIDSIDDYLYDKPLLLIGEDGANLVNRSTPIAFMAYGKYWVNNHAHVLDGINEQFLIYLSLYINSISLLPYITGMAQPKMNQAKMNSILVLLPPEAEQPRIVAKVDELMALCDSLKERIHESQTTQLYLADAMAEQALN